MIPPGLTILVVTGIAGLLASSYFDQPWSRWLYEHGSPAFGKWMGRTIFEGGLPGASDPAIIFLLVSLWLYLKCWNRKAGQRLTRWRPFLGFIVTAALAGALGVVHSLKWVIGRARPYEVWNHSWPYTEWFESGPHYITEGIYSGSFPSGHTAVVISLLTLSYSWYGLQQDKPLARFGVVLFTLAVIAWGCLMGLGRVVSAHHWISDSLGMILPIWAVLHAIYFHLLKIPLQLAYLEKNPEGPDLPRYWELKIVALALPVLLGVMAIMLGFRSLEFQETPWLLLLSLAGVLLIMFFRERWKLLYFHGLSCFMETGKEPDDEILNSHD